MTLLVIVAVIALVKMTEIEPRLQSDAWYHGWCQSVGSWFDQPRLRLFVQILAPLAGLWALLEIVDSFSLLLFLAAVVLLIYSLGRGDPETWLRGYAEAAQRNDNEVATDYAERLGVSIGAVGGWPALHASVFRQAAYRGYERWFPLLFWFVLLGPLGAVFYRLVSLSATSSENSELLRQGGKRLLWYLDWPALRCLGLSLALTGNFQTGWSHWKETLFDMETESAQTLDWYMRGALSHNSSEIESESTSLADIESVMPQLQRALFLWVFLIAIAVFFT